MKPDARRRAQLAKIHILAKQIGMDDWSYRNLLWVVARVDSAKDLDAYGRDQVIRQLEAHLPASKRAEKPRPAEDKARMLHRITGLLGDRGEDYALGILRRMFAQDAPDRLDWASPTQLHKLIAALEYDRRRAEKRDAAQQPEASS